METKQKLKVGDKIVCITDSYKDLTKGKEYEIINVDSNNRSVLNDDKVSINFLSLHNSFKLKEEKEELKPHSFCETPEEKWDIKNLLNLQKVFEMKDKKHIEQITKYYKNLWKQNKN